MIWAGILLAQILLFYCLSFSDGAVALAARLFRWKAAYSQALFSESVFSAGDWLYVIFTIGLTALMIYIFKGKNKSAIIYPTVVVINIFYFVYQMVWGLMYFQKPVSNIFPERQPTLAEAKSIAIVLLERCQTTRKMVQEDQNGVFKVYDIKKVEADILKGQRSLPPMFHADFATGINNFKPSLFKNFISATGILGYYNPITAEAHYNPNLPSSLLPFTLAHESAHQLGFAREQEANFIGYVLGNSSQNADLKYSAQLYALRSILNAVYPTDSLFVKKMIRQYTPGMARDRAFEKAFAKRNYGTAAQVFSFTNDLFLKSNRQDGAITYSYFTDLLLKYELKQKNRVSQRDSKNTNDEKKFTPCADCSVTKRVKDITKTTN